MTTIGDAAKIDARPLAPCAALFAGAVVMGASPILVRLAEVGPFASAFWRVAVALPALWAWQEFERRAAGAAIARRDLTAPVVCAGLFFAGDLFFWHLSIVGTTVANATFLATTSPIWVALGATLLFGERVSAATLLGIALTIAGGAALIADSVEVAPDRLAGDASAALAAIFFGSYVLALGRARRTHGGARLIYLLSLVSLVPLLGAALLLEDRLMPRTASGAAAIAALALVVHAGGQGLLSHALGHLPATFSSLALFIAAIAAALLGWIALGEALTATQVAGGLVILIGIYVARPRAAKSEPRQ